MLIDTENPLQDLAGKNNLNVTDIKYFTDYIRAKYEDMQNIVSGSYRRTRSEQSNQLKSLWVLIANRISLSLSVYVFVGGQWALDDFMLCLQDKKLLDSGDYMVISVNDEFYNPDLKTIQDGRQSEYSRWLSCLSAAGISSCIAIVELFFII